MPEKRDDVAIAVVRNIIALHEGSREILIEEAAKTVRRAIDRAVHAAATADLDAKMREIEQEATADVAKKTDEFALSVTQGSTETSFTLGEKSLEPATESPNSPEEIRGRLLDWLRANGRRFSLEYAATPSMWMARLSCLRSGSHVYDVEAVGNRLNHLDAIEDALDEVGTDEERGSVPVGSAS